jgi:hypothetical protein
MAFAGARPRIDDNPAWRHAQDRHFPLRRSGCRRRKLRLRVFGGPCQLAGLNPVTRFFL